MRILVIDDDEDIRDILTMLHTAQGHEVVTRPTASRGLISCAWVAVPP